jgi:hypothetical protein
MAVVGKFFARDQGAKNDDVSDAICPSERVALAAWGEHVERIAAGAAITALRGRARHNGTTNRTGVTTMRKLLIAAVIALAAFCYGIAHQPSAAIETAAEAKRSAGPPASECHMLSSRQVYQIHQAVEQMKQLDPNGRRPDDEDLQVANVVDQLMCSGASYEEAVQEVLGFIRATSKLRSQ